MPERNLLLVLSIVVGLCSGFAAVLLKKAIGLIRHLLTFWFDSASDNWFYLIYPGIGMLISFLILKYIVRDNISHGVTKVLYAISRKESQIKPHNTWSSLLTSSVTIGFGGSVGAEAPIVYTGAAIGSNVARWLGLSYRQMTILLGCGAAGAVAGIFKAPLAGALFTLEILMFNISMTSIMPLLISSVSGTFVTYLFSGKAVEFGNDIATFALSNIPYYILLGIFCGFMSLYFIRSTLWAEDKLKNLKRPFFRWALCSILLGILIFLFPPLYGEGYDALAAMLNNNPIESAGRTLVTDAGRSPFLVVAFFALIMLVKVFATALTNAGGGVGGTFGPTLVVGALAGFVLSRLINISGIASIPEENFVLVGMSGLMAGVMQAPLTAIFLIAEMTGGYALFYPLIITSVISFATIRGFEKYSIYTKRIAQQGDLLTHDSDQAVLTLLKTADLIECDFATVNLYGTLGDLVRTVAETKRNIFPVVDNDNRFQGVVFLDDIRQYMFDRDQDDKIYIYTIMKPSPDFVYQDEKMESVMNKFEETKAWNLPVLDEEGRYVGFVSKSKIFSSYREQLQQVSNE